MGKGIWIGDDTNISRKAKNIFIGGDDNLAHKVKNIYIGDSNNLARLCWSSAPPELYLFKQGTAAFQNCSLGENNIYEIRDVFVNCYPGEGRGMNFFFLYGAPFSQYSKIQIKYGVYAAWMYVGYSSSPHGNTELPYGFDYYIGDGGQLNNDLTFSLGGMKDTDYLKFYFDPLNSNDSQATVSEIKLIQ